MTSFKLLLAFLDNSKQALITPIHWVSTSGTAAVGVSSKIRGRFDPEPTQP